MTDRGYSLIEVLAVVALVMVLAAAAIPYAASSVEQSRTSGAARYLANRLMLTRFEAIKRSRFVGVQFVERSDGYWLRTYADGNGNGVLARDVSRGLDPPISIDERLDQQFPGVTFGICPDVTAIVPGETLDPSDPIQIGASTIMSFNPNGSSTGGTLYIRGRHANQYAVRVLGITARARVFRFDFADHLWRMQ